MRRLTLILLLSLAAHVHAVGPQSFQVIAYHDVRDDVVADIDPDQYAVSTEMLTAHFRWLRDHGYHPVSMDQILSARAGGERLPDKAVLLTFDDGYVNHYHRVYPLLRAFDYPAIFSLVTSWMNTEPGGQIQYGPEPLYREDFMSWGQVREMAASGLAEFASHSHELHRGALGNPQGNEQPAAVTRLVVSGHYEDDQAYLARLRSDISRSVDSLRVHLGAAPRIMTWPYGRYNEYVLQIAADLGMTINLTLDDGAGSATSLERVPRHLISANPDPADFAAMLMYPARPAIVRAAHVDLDYLYDEDQAQQSVNLDNLLDRIRALQISHVFLQAFADPDADGAAESLYFPNRHMPVRADLFNRVAWQLKTRSEVQVYAWMPVLAFDNPAFDDKLYVREQLVSGTRMDPNGEPRLSPFDPGARRIIREIYRDLAVYAHFDGLLFHDDARLNEFEDASLAGVRALKALLGPQAEFSLLQRDGRAAASWARHKRETLTAFTLELRDQVRKFRPDVKTARNLFADTVLAPESEAWLAQSLSDAMASYDYIALMAMPHLEGRDDSRRFLDELAARVARIPLGPEKVIFELQSVDWRNGRPIPASRLQHQMRRLQSQGIRHLAWYPDDFVAGKPELEQLRQGASLADYTHRRR